MIRFVPPMESWVCTAARRVHTPLPAAVSQTLGDAVGPLAASVNVLTTKSAASVGVTDRSSSAPAIAAAQTMRLDISFPLYASEPAIARLLCWYAVIVATAATRNRA